MKKKYNILYVDDEEDNLLAFRSVFRRFFNVYTATSGDDAIALLARHPVHLILSDQRMPGMTGVELCENVMKSHPESIRMIVTGYSEMKPINEAMEAGKVADCIVKPWNVEELRAVLENALSVA